MDNAPGKNPDRRQAAKNLTLAVMAGSVGCVTLVIVLAAVGGGLLLDRQFDSKPAFTLGLLLVSIPVSLVAMFAIVRAAVGRIKSATDAGKTDSVEGSDLGRNQTA